MRIQLLGGFRVFLDGGAVPDEAWRLRKAAALVKLLALSPHLRLHRDQLVEHLWPEADPFSSANSLHQVLHAARRALAAGPGATHATALLRLQNEVVSLPPETAVDVAAFESAAALARAEGGEPACEAALAIYTGDLLPEDPYADWAAPRRDRLRDAYLQLLQEVARLREKRGDVTGAVGALERIVAADAARETAHLSLMRLYDALGEPARAVRQYQQLAQALQRELDAEPGVETRALYASLLSRSTREAGTAGQVHGGAVSAELRLAIPNMPGGALPLALTSFVGREDEIDTLERQLRAPAEGGRLLTLTGPGGAGKSRLALEVARRLSRTNTFPDGAWHVDLEGLTGGGRLAQRVAASLAVTLDSDLPAPEALARALERRTLLLLLDGCEHVARACAALVAALLTHCPNVRVLATSREALRVPGERTWHVPPLSLPTTGGSGAEEEWTHSDAMSLFLERAREARPGFALTPQNRQAVGEICRRLDGLPLAIELAAARVRVLTVEQIARRLDARFDLLTGGSSVPARHQTLLATMDWSHELLSEPERTLFRRLAVFERGWNLDEAEAVCAGEGLLVSQVLDLLTQLVDKSLVVAEPDPAGPTHFRMLETVREYAWGELAASGELEATQERHARLLGAGVAVRADESLPQGEAVR